ncbi:MAG: hypothetical protein JST75_02340 [Bacteroidetes bacterium]|nr:hypothetical protein [Bacteroidota bacterium]
MKKLFLLLMLVAFISLGTQAQDALKQATSAATSAGFDVKSLTSSIMNKLGPSLKLTGDQKPGVMSAVSGFLGEKAKILPLQQSDPTSYATKQGGLFNSLKSKLGGILTAVQLTKFMGLKPKTNDATNVLSNLFF